MSLHPLLLSILFLSLPPQAFSNFTATLFFGDSTLDTGNNNYLPSPTKANHSPYGLNFPNRTPTGRFCDGLLISDLVTSGLGIKPLSPPFLDPNLSDRDVRTGVNFASSGSGLDELTSTVTITVPISGQLMWFEEYVKRLNRNEGEEEAKRILEGALVMVSSGTNDVIINYYDLPRRRMEFNISGYHDFLLQKLEGAIKNIYNHGVRKFIVAGPLPIGCLPLQITFSFKNPLDRQCVDEQVSDTIAYNSKLKKFLLLLHQSLPESKLVYWDLTDDVIDILKNPAKYGFEEGTNRGCCGTGLFEFGPLCNDLTPLCQNVSNSVFFDAIHPTERLYKLISDHVLENLIPKLY